MQGVARRFRSIRACSSPNTILPDAPVVGDYIANVRAVIREGALDTALAARFAESPHSWALPYIRSLIDLSLLEEARLGQIICSIPSKTTLSRLTNLTNFLFCIEQTLSTAFSQSQPRSLTEDERAELGRLIDCFLLFVQAQAWPTIVSGNDTSYTEMYLILARALIVSSYVIGNQMRGYKEVPEARRQALEGLAIARLALKIVSSPENQIFLDRNEVLLKIADIVEPDAITEIYFKAFDAIADYAKPAAFTSIIEDFLLICESRKAPQMLDALLARLVTIPRELIIPEQIIDGIFYQLLALQESGQRELLEKLIVSYCTFFSEVLRHTAAKEPADTFAKMIVLASNALHRHEKTREGLLSLLRHLRSVLDQGSCSSLFITAVLKGAQTGQFTLQLKGDAALIPFETTLTVFTIEELNQFTKDETEEEWLRMFDSVTMAWTSYQPPKGDVQTSVTFYPTIAGIDAESYAEAETFMRTISHRILQKYAGPITEEN